MNPGAREGWQFLLVSYKTSAVLLIVMTGKSLVSDIRQITFTKTEEAVMMISFYLDDIY
jgi:hypothetical protein